MRYSKKSKSLIKLKFHPKSVRIEKLSTSRFDILPGNMKVKTEKLCAQQVNKAKDAKNEALRKRQEKTQQQ